MACGKNRMGRGMRSPVKSIPLAGQPVSREELCKLRGSPKVLSRPLKKQMMGVQGVGEGCLHDVSSLFLPPHPFGFYFLREHSKTISLLKTSPHLFSFSF